MSTAPLSIQNRYDSPRTSNPPNLHLLVLKPVSKTIDWAEYCVGRLPKPVGEAHELLKRTRDGFRLMKLPTEVRKLLRSIAALKRGDAVFEKSIETFRNAMLVTMVGVTSIHLLRSYDFLELSRDQIIFLNAIGCLNCLSIILNGIIEIKNNFILMTHTERWGVEFNTAFINIGIKICAIVAAIFGMIVFLASGEAVSKVTLLGVTSVGLFFNISKYYYNII